MQAIRDFIEGVVACGSVGIFIKAVLGLVLVVMVPVVVLYYLLTNI